MLLSLATNHGTTDSMVNDKLGEIVNKIPTALFKAYSCVWAFLLTWPWPSLEVACSSYILLAMKVLVDRGIGHVQWTLS